MVSECRAYERIFYILFSLLDSCGSNYVFNGEAGLGLDGWSRISKDTITTASFVATQGTSHFVLKSISSITSSSASLTQDIVLPGVKISEMQFQ